MNFKQAGFTLIELMITVAIIGILSSIALPSYSQYINRGRIFEGVSQLAITGIKLEQYLQDNGGYNNGTECGVTMPNNANFKYECIIEPAETNSLLGSKYTITMTGLNTLSDYVFTLDQNNQHKSTIKSVSKYCWVVGSTCL